MGNAAPNLDAAWAQAMRRRQLQRAAAGFGDTPALGPDGKVHPRCIFDAITEVAAADYVAIADGGDLLSFARIGLAPARTYMDAGAFGCLGVGVPFGIAAALAFPSRQVISVNGDGAFGINAMEVDTAVRHGAKAVFIVSNNAAWNIERYDQEANYGGRVVGTTLRHSDYAAMARALGAHGERVEKPEELAGALERALQHAPAVVDVVTSQAAVSSDAKKGLGYVPDYQPLTAWDEAERRRREQRH
jgi:acetolactate synthase-1/2/3 large subunit